MIAFLTKVAEEARALVAKLGFIGLAEIRGRTDLLFQAVCGPEASYLDLAKLLTPVGRDDEPWPDSGRSAAAQVEDLNRRLVARAGPAIAGEADVNLRCSIRNVNRAIGATLSGEIARRFGSAGLQTRQVEATFLGSAGQSFGAFLAPGVRLTLIGEANDYVGKGMAGGEIVVRPPSGADFIWSENVIAAIRSFMGPPGARFSWQVAPGNVCCTKQRRAGGGGRYWGSRLRIYDRGPGGGIRAHRPEFRGRHDRWGRICAG